MPAIAEPKGFAYFCQHFPVHQGLAGTPSLDVPVHVRGPFGEREPPQLSLSEEDPRPSPTFSYVLGNRNEHLNGGSQMPNQGLYSSVFKPLFVNTLQKCILVGSRLATKTGVWLFKRVS